MLKFTEDISIEAAQYAIKMCGNCQGEEQFYKLKKGKKKLNVLETMNWISSVNDLT